MVIDHKFFMSLALTEAWKYQGLTYPNPAVGCTIVGAHNELLAVSAHKKAGNPHAEVEALKEAYTQLTQDTKIIELTSSHAIHDYLLQNHNNCFHDITLYTTLEPCSHIGKTPSCASLIASLGIKKVYVGSRDTNPEAACGNEVLKLHNIDVQDSLMLQECDELLYPFLKWNEKQFIFFKWAQRLSGTFDEGSISCAASKEHVHKLRDRCDLLVIGGNTLRVDRPILDARLINGKAPDILIYSKQTDFDRTIPLFNIPNRKVVIMDNFSLLENYKNIMIEGGANMFELTCDIVDYYLCYIAPDFGGKAGFENCSAKFKILNSQQVDKDIILWMKTANENTEEKL